VARLGFLEDVMSDRTVTSETVLREILSNIEFAPSCLDMGWEWKITGVVGGSTRIFYADIGDIPPADVADYLAKVRASLKGYEDVLFVPYRSPAEPPLVADQIGWLVSTTFQRPDTNTSEVSRGEGRQWFIAKGTTESGVVKTAWLAAKQIVEHELMEAFRYLGSRVFDPHKTIYELSR
jgi:hypothetical protein